MFINRILNQQLSTNWHGRGLWPLRSLIYLTRQNPIVKMEPVTLKSGWVFHFLTRSTEKNPLSLLFSTVVSSSRRGLPKGPSRPGSDNQVLTREKPLMPVKKSLRKLQEAGAAIIEQDPKKIQSGPVDKNTALLRNSLSRRPTLPLKRLTKLILPKDPRLFSLISIKRTKNNTHATIANLFGEIKTKWAISAGQLKLSGGRRKTRLSQRILYKTCLEKALSLGYKYSLIHCQGTRGSKVRIFRSFSSKNDMSVLLIKDTTGVAHNGCRPPKVRRV